MDDDIEATEVIVIGAGPSGLALAACLATQGITSVVLEKDTEIWPYPRAFRNSEDALRVLQSAGLLYETYEKINSGYGNKGKFVAGRHHDLSKPGFVKMDLEYVS